jgi:hypothetical protein
MVRLSRAVDRGLACQYSTLHAGRAGDTAHVVTREDLRMKRKGSGWVSSLWREAYARDCKFAIRSQRHGMTCAAVQSIAIVNDSSRALNCVGSSFAGTRKDISAG